LRHTRALVYFWPRLSMFTASVRCLACAHSQLSCRTELSSPCTFHSHPLPPLHTPALCLTTPILQCPAPSCCCSCHTEWKWRERPQLSLACPQLQDKVHTHYGLALRRGDSEFSTFCAVLSCGAAHLSRGSNLVA